MRAEVEDGKGGFWSRWLGAEQAQPALAQELVTDPVPLEKPLPGIGVSDLPAADDLLGVEPYVRGLADFIAACPSPMTIAIQGGWGTGKTSTMKMVEGQLRAQDMPCVIVTFNTWQYEHTDLGEGLTYHLVRAILEQVALPAEMERSRAILNALKRGAWRLSQEAVQAAVRAADAAAAHAASVAGGELGAKAYAAGRDSVAESFGPKALDRSATEQLIDVRAHFAQVVRTRVNEFTADQGRVVVFIDDLDRLDPARAVEVMESLKALLDCAGCVFVLAVDFEVVQQGVRAKYKDMTNERVRAFFDKIIQVPFHMPVSAYALDKVFDEGLGQVGLDKETRLLCRRVGIRAVDNNPRAAKRLINSFVMLRRVGERTDPDSAVRSSGPRVQREMIKDDARLFAFLALKAAFPEFAQKAERITDESAAPFFSSAVEAAGACGEHAEAQLESWGVEPKDRARFADVLEEVIDTFGMGDGKSSVSYGKITNLAAVTSVGVRPLERSTVLAPSVRAQRRLAAGTDQAVVELARQIEDEVRAAFEARGMSTVGAESKNGTQWTLAVSGAGKGSSRSGQIFFPAKGDSLQVVLPWRQSASPEARGLFASWVQALCDARKWEYIAGDGLSYIRIRGIRVGDNVSGLADLFVRAYDVGR